MGSFVSHFWSRRWSINQLAMNGHVHSRNQATRCTIRSCFHDEWLALKLEDYERADADFHMILSDRGKIIHAWFIVVPLTNICSMWWYFATWRFINTRRCRAWNRAWIDEFQFLFQESSNRLRFPSEILSLTTRCDENTISNRTLLNFTTRWNFPRPLRPPSREVAGPNSCFF